MKKLTLLCALLLALNAGAQTNEPPKLTFVEGMCAGVVLGAATGIVIVIGIRCWQKPPPLVQGTNAPGWTTLPPAGTNSPPPGTNATATIDAGDAVEHVDLTPLGLPGITEGMRFIIEASDDAQNFYTIYEFKAWMGEGGMLGKVSDDGHEVASYSPKGGMMVFPIDLCTAPYRFFRVKKP